MKNKKMEPIGILFLGFAAIIIVGALLLLLPFATKDGVSVSIIDALFVSASAACVTGLSPVNTADTWSLFGQIVILILIQIGGLGFMTVISVVYMIFKRNLGLYGQTIMMQSAGTFSIALVKPLIKKILFGTLIFELVGAGLLCFFLWPTHGTDSIWLGVFHSISAFCNAGFDLFGDSLESYAGNYGVILTICALILIGGIGFVVWHDIVSNKGNFTKYQMHTKIVLTATLLLTIIPFAAFYLMEFTSFGNLISYTDPITNEVMPVGERILNAFFLAVTPRTAGFASVPYADLSSGSKGLTMILMFIGGNSGSTAGGIKVTTIAVIILNLIANAQGKSSATVFKRRIPSSIINQSCALLFSYLSLFVISAIIVTAVDINVDLEGALFETISAIATVGLSLDITSKLGIVSKIIIIFLMYVGRLGAFALFDFLLGHAPMEQVKHPEGRIMVG